MQKLRQMFILSFIPRFIINQAFINTVYSINILYAYKSVYTHTHKYKHNTQRIISHGIQIICIKIEKKIILSIQ